MCLLACVLLLRELFNHIGNTYKQRILHVGVHPGFGCTPGRSSLSSQPPLGVHPGFGRTPGPPAGWVATPPQGRAAYGDPPVTADGRLPLAQGRAVRLFVVFSSGLANPLLVTASDWGGREESAPPLPASAYGLRRGSGGRH